MLLYFIKKDEIDIYDIPIAKITSEFLKYIKLMQYFDLELAGEFLVMASTLMYIKTQMLLPSSGENGGEEAEDPRTMLVERLIEYRLFKSAAKDLSEYAEEQRYVYYRKLFNEDSKLAASYGEESYKNATVFDLLKAFQNIMERSKKKEHVHVVTFEPVTLEEKKELILNMLQVSKKISFFGITKDDNRHHIVVTFLALLEMIKLRLINIIQSDLFDDILIVPAFMGAD